MQGLALVDYDNICKARDTGRPGRTGSTWTRGDFKRRTGDLVEAFARAFGACKNDRNLNALFGHADWETIESLLVKHDLVTVEHRVTKGRPKVFLRRQFLPEHIMAGFSGRPDDPRVQLFWQDLVQESKADEP